MSQTSDLCGNMAEMKDKPEETDGSTSTSLRFWRYLVGYALTVVVAAILAHILWRHRELALRLIRLSPYALSIVAVVVTITLVARAVFLHKLVQELGASVPVRECFLLVGMTNLLSMTTLPGAGAAYRTSYVFRRHGVAILPFVGGTALFAIFGVLIWSVLGTAALITSGINVENINRRLLLVLLVVAAGLAAFRPVRVVLRRVSYSRLRRAGRLAEESFRVSSSPSLCRTAVKVMLCCAAAQVAGFYLIFRCFSLPVGPIDTLAIVAFHQLGGFVGLTPGSVGVQEGIGIAVSTQLGLDMASLVVVLALVRAGRLGMSILVGVPCWWWLLKKKSIPA